MSKNRKEIYDTVIVPLIEQLRAACKKNEMPMFTTVCYDMNNGVPQYGTEFVSDYDLRTNLPANNNIANCIKATNGFKVVSVEHDIINPEDFIVSEETEES